jgi:exopolysaccharide biosynthesis protein
MLLACSGGGTSTLTLEWQPVDSLNRRLPETIRVYAGRRGATPLRAWYVKIEEAAPLVETRALLSDDASDSRETVSSFANDSTVCVAINGGYFSMDRTPALHGGLLVTDGVVRAPATRRVFRDSIEYEVARAAIGFTQGGLVQIRWATTRSDTVFSWPYPPPHRPGAPALSLDYTQSERWDIVHAVSAGPMLVVDGEVRVAVDEEVFFGSSIPNTHPRTAAGRTADGALMLLVVDGRQPASRGVNLEELAEIMRDLGAVQALNLDGGGSTALVVDGILLNRPTGGTAEREVMSALVTTCR